MKALLCHRQLPFAFGQLEKLTGLPGFHSYEPLGSSKFFLDHGFESGSSQKSFLFFFFIFTLSHDCCCIFLTFESVTSGLLALINSVSWTAVNLLLTSSICWNVLSFNCKQKKDTNKHYTQYVNCLYVG